MAGDYSRSSLLGVGAEKVTGKVGLFSLIIFIFIDVVLAVVLGAAADVAEGLETGSGSGVRVDIDGLATLNILEKSHSRVARVILHHIGVGLTCSDVVRGVLENASLTIRALRGVLKEVFADGGKVLSAEALLLLELILAVCESAALLFLAVLARLTLEPEAAELSLDLLLPAILGLAIFGTDSSTFLIEAGGLAGELSDGGVESAHVVEAALVFTRVHAALR